MPLKMKTKSNLYSEYQEPLDMFCRVYMVDKMVQYVDEIIDSYTDKLSYYQFFAKYKDKLDVLHPGTAVAVIERKTKNPKLSTALDITNFIDSLRRQRKLPSVKSTGIFLYNPKYWYEMFERYDSTAEDFIDWTKGYFKKSTIEWYFRKSSNVRDAKLEICVSVSAYIKELKKPVIPFEKKIINHNSLANRLQAIEEFKRLHGH